MVEGGGFSPEYVDLGNLYLGCILTRDFKLGIPVIVYEVVDYEGCFLILNPLKVTMEGHLQAFTSQRILAHLETMGSIYRLANTEVTIDNSQIYLN